MVTEQLFVRPGSWHPWQHCRFVIPPGNPNHGRHIHANVNGSGADASFENASGSYVDVILGRATDPGIDGDRTG